MTAAQTAGLVAYDAFLVMEKATEERHEWVNGVVYAMSRGSPEHGRLTARVIARMLTPLLADGCEIFASDTAIFIEAARHHTYADASVVCGSLITRTVRDKNGQSIGEAIVNPAVVVEVLSEATERYDCDGKFQAYAQLASLEAYVLVSQTERRIEVRSRHGDGWAVRVAGAGESIAVHGREVSVDAIYR